MLHRNVRPDLRRGTECAPISRDLGGFTLQAAEALSQASMKAYRALVYDTPEFLTYFEQATPIG